MLLLKSDVQLLAEHQPRVSHLWCAQYSLTDPSKALPGAIKGAAQQGWKS